MSSYSVFGGGLLVAIGAAIMGDEVFLSVMNLDIYGPKPCMIRTLSRGATALVGYGGFTYIAMRIGSRV